MSAAGGALRGRSGVWARLVGVLRDADAATDKPTACGVCVVCGAQGAAALASTTSNKAIIQETRWGKVDVVLETRLHLRHPRAEGRCAAAAARYAGQAVASAAAAGRAAAAALALYRRARFFSWQV